MEDMKKYILICLLCIPVTLLTGCDDSFMNYMPKTNPTEETAFVSYDNFKTYSWGLYGIFSNNQMKQFIDVSADRLTMADGDFQANYLCKSDGSNVQNNNWQWNNITPSINADDGWNFDYIRRVNILLRNIDGSQMTDAEKDHWRSVGYFFRSYRYYDLLARYGDVPWLEDVVSDEDTDILYGPRTPRDEVAANILRDLKFAETHIKTDGDGQNTINQATVRALMSRFCLFEGTWRKYHNLAGGDTYLAECERVSEELLSKYPSIAPRYTDVWSSDDLGKVDGIILYKECLPDLIMSTFPRHERGGSQKYGLHARTIGRYLCQDGKPVSVSSQYEGKGATATMNDEFKNRDFRLYWRCIPPYKTKIGNGVAVTDENQNDWWDDSMNSKDRYYIDYMNNVVNKDDPYHQFPMRTWQPQFLSRVPMVQTSKYSWGPMRNYSGYYLYMTYSTYNEQAIQAGGRYAVSDCPIFHIEEIMLNYAEVEFELSKFNQGIADQTINKLRARAHVAPMTVADITADFDPERDPAVDPVAWEIRRERMAELMGEGFGFYDIRRWKRADYFMNQRPLGARVAADETDEYFGNGSIFIKESDVNPAASVFPEDVGRVVCVGDFMQQGKGWKDIYYLNPIPQKQLTLNDKLEQNPGWEKE